VHLLEASAQCYVHLDAKDDFGFSLAYGSDLPSKSRAISKASSVGVIDIQTPSVQKIDVRTRS
jgi:hypothetical protein